MLVGTQTYSSPLPPKGDKEGGTAVSGQQEINRQDAKDAKGAKGLKIDPSVDGLEIDPSVDGLKIGMLSGGFFQVAATEIC